VSAVGEVTGAWLTRAAPQPPENIPYHKRSFVCLCSDVSTADLRDGVSEGFDHIETLKALYDAHDGPVPGRMCQLAGIGVCAHETGERWGKLA